MRSLAVRPIGLHNLADMDEAASERSGILFLCVANSARSQMAEALARRVAPAGVEIFSAGASPGRIHPLAVRVLTELGIDATSQYSKSVDQVPPERIATVITLCDADVCPSFGRAIERLHWPFEDPASMGTSENERLEAFRRIRDEIRERVERFLTDR